MVVICNTDTGDVSVHGGPLEYPPLDGPEAAAALMEAAEILGSAAEEAAGQVSVSLAAGEPETQTEATPA